MLWHNRAVWEKLAIKDPLWAVLTDVEKVNRRWDKDEFYSTGKQVVAADMAYIINKHPTLSRGHVLDFGCGVGRLSKALLSYFDHVTGVDISPTMLEIAKENLGQDGRINFVHNSLGDLRNFADESFDMIYSIITLQHIKPKHSKRYVEEFIRVCRPDGVVFFQQISALDKLRRMSLYPPTIWKHIKRRLAIDAAMEMNPVRREEMIEVIEDAGGVLVETVPYPAAGKCESWGFLVRPNVKTGHKISGLTRSIGTT